MINEAEVDALAEKLARAEWGGSPSLKEAAPAAAERIRSLARVAIEHLGEAELGGASMIYHEIHAVLKRYTSEAGETTVFTILGAMDAARQDVLDMLRLHNERRGDSR